MYILIINGIHNNCRRDIYNKVSLIDIEELYDKALLIIYLIIN